MTSYENMEETLRLLGDGCLNVIDSLVEMIRVPFYKDYKDCSEARLAENEKKFIYTTRLDDGSLALGVMFRANRHISHILRIFSAETRVPLPKGIKAVHVPGFLPGDNPGRADLLALKNLLHELGLPEEHFCALPPAKEPRTPFPALLQRCVESFRERFRVLLAAEPSQCAFLWVDNDIFSSARDVPRHILQKSLQEYLRLHFTEALHFGGSAGLRQDTRFPGEFYVPLEGDQDLRLFCFGDSLHLTVKKKEDVRRLISGDLPLIVKRHQSTFPEEPAMLHSIMRLLWSSSNNDEIPEEFRRYVPQAMLDETLARVDCPEMAQLLRRKAVHRQKLPGEKNGLVFVGEPGVGKSHKIFAMTGKQGTSPCVISKDQYTVFWGRCGAAIISVPSGANINEPLKGNSEKLLRFWRKMTVSMGHILFNWVIDEADTLLRPVEYKSRGETSNAAQLSTLQAIMDQEGYSPDNACFFFATNLEKIAEAIERRCQVIRVERLSAVEVQECLQLHPQPPHTLRKFLSDFGVNLTRQEFFSLWRRLESEVGLVVRYNAESLTISDARKMIACLRQRSVSHRRRVWRRVDPALLVEKPITLEVIGERLCYRCQRVTPGGDTFIWVPFDLAQDIDGYDEILCQVPVSDGKQTDLEVHLKELNRVLERARKCEQKISVLFHPTFLAREDLRVRSTTRQHLDDDGEAALSVLLQREKQASKGTGYGSGLFDRRAMPRTSGYIQSSQSVAQSISQTARMKHLVTVQETENMPLQHPHLEAKLVIAITQMLQRFDCTHAELTLQFQTQHECLAFKARLPQVKEWSDMPSMTEYQARQALSAGSLVINERFHFKDTALGKFAAARFDPNGRMYACPASVVNFVEIEKQWNALLDGSKTPEPLYGDSAFKRSLWQSLWIDKSMPSSKEPVTSFRPIYFQRFKLLAEYFCSEAANVTALEYKKQLVDETRRAFFHH